MNIGDIDKLVWDKTVGPMTSLIPAVIQHADSGAVLMVGYMSRESLRDTLTGGRVVFYSRSRQRLWMKGETSGHYLNVVSVTSDCDADTLLILVEPTGPVCHRGTGTCFADQPPTAAERLTFLAQLEAIIG